MKMSLPSALAALLFAAPALGADLKYPDTSITPGKARADVTVEELCATDWKRADKPVSTAKQRDIFAEYHLKGSNDPSCRVDGAAKCRIDHLIARKLGGADTETNLWPQPLMASWGASAKDKLEDCMHARVCAKLAANGPNAAERMLRLYQRDIVNDWIAAYRNVIGGEAAVCTMPS